MKLQKIILCTAIALCAFGASLGLLEIGAYLRAAFEPLKVELKPFEPVQPFVVYQPGTLNFAAPALTATAETAPVEQAEPEDEGFNGDYYIIDEKPKGFRSFEQLTIQDRDWSEKAEKIVPIKPRGLIYAGEVTFDYSWINIKGQRVSLETEKHRGVSYRFVGGSVDEEARLKDENGEEYPVRVYLKGRLSKWRDGKKIAEAKVRMGISHGC